MKAWQHYDIIYYPFAVNCGCVSINHMYKTIGFIDLVTLNLDHKLASCHLLYAIAKLICNKN